MSYQTSFSVIHQNGDFKVWVVPSSKGPDFAKCKYCNKDISIGNMGTSGLKSHSRGVKHKLNVASALSTPSVRPSVPATTTAPIVSDLPNNCVDNGTDPSVTSSSTTSVNIARTSSIRSFVGSTDHNDKVLKAEIFWTLYTVCQNNSFTSNNCIGGLFKQMFPDSKIANSFTCAETKTKYTLENGIQVYFRDLLLNNLTNNLITK